MRHAFFIVSTSSLRPLSHYNTITVLMKNFRNPDLMARCNEEKMLKINLLRHISRKYFFLKRWFHCKYEWDCLVTSVFKGVLHAVARIYYFFIKYICCNQKYNEWKLNFIQRIAYSLNPSWCASLFIPIALSIEKEIIYILLLYSFFNIYTVRIY